MFPQEYSDRMRGMLGPEYEAFEVSMEGEPYRALRVNTLKGTAENFLEKRLFELTPVPWSQNGFYYSPADHPGKHPFHEAGVYYIQEPSAMFPARLLEAQPGERVLDLCAAPGGKTTQIAADMKGEGILAANEIHPARARILSENVERMGIRNALVMNETPDRLAGMFREYFDRILVDAPCSGEGMFRRNEEAVLEWSAENVALCASRQDEILDCAAAMLRPGGRLVYSTCTFAPSENEGTIDRFLNRHSDFSLMPVEKPAGISDGVPAWSGSGLQEMSDTCRLWPHRLKGEGHFAALMEKEGQGINVDGSLRTVQERGITLKECGEYPEFQHRMLPEDLEGILLRFGDQLYLAPKGTPPLKGIKVLRPGLHLGTLKKNRFEPSHALALYLNPEETACTYRLSLEDERVKQYLSGLTIPAEGDKGFHLITVDGYSLGWGKLSGTVMKNHYPRGLRKYL